MGMFDNLEVASDVQEAKDVVGGFAKIDETGMYEFTVEKAYADKSSGGAFNVNLELKADNGAILRVTEYITSGLEKGCKNYYVDKNGNKQFLPGYNKIHSLDVLLTDEDNPFPSTEAGMVKLYDNDAKKEVPTEKEIIKNWLGKKVKALVMKKLEDKRAKGDDGYYHPTTESREIYEVQHFLDAETEQTLNEKKDGNNGFKDKWLSKFDSNFVMDKRDKSKNSNSDNSSGSNDDVPEDNPF